MSLRGAPFQRGDVAIRFPVELLILIVHESQEAVFFRDGQALVEGDVDGAKELCAKLAGILAERNRVCSVSK